MLNLERERALRLHIEYRKQISIPDPAYQVIRTKHTIRILGPGPQAFQNSVIFCLDPQDPMLMQQSIVEEINYFRKLGHAFEWKWHDYDLPAYLSDLLLEAGFIKGESESILYWMTDQLIEQQPNIPDHLILKEITHRSQIDDLVKIQNEVWQDDFSWLGKNLIQELQAEPDSLLILVAYQHEQPVSCGWIRYDKQIATLHGGSTIQGSRGQGIYRTLVCQRLLNAKKKGIEVVMSDATAESQPILGRLGFRILGQTIPYIYKP